jgi:radical SAM family uncharacterized protein
MSRPLRDKIDALLEQERGTIRKAQSELNICLAYPNTYHVGMSNLGVHQIYSLVNKRNDAVCERVFLPDSEDIETYKTTNTKLFSIENKRPVREFDVLAFSVSFEQDYLNVLEMLSLADIPLAKEERSDDDPLLVLGGICSFFNPEPLADLFDVVIIGEGEEVMNEFMDSFKEARSKARKELLRSLCTIPGVYVPEFYDVRYHDDGTIKERIVLESHAPVRIKKRTIKDINALPAATVIQTPNTEFSNMYLSEVTRGCGRHCRFCMAGYIYLPPRNLNIAVAQEQAAKADDACGKIGLVGAAISDYPDIKDLCASIEGNVAVSSLRADSVSEALIERLAKSGHKTIAIAPEAASERMRKVINKGITEEDILRAADMIFKHGIPNLKLYFIIGLPSETQEDVDAIIALAGKVHEVQLTHARPLGRIGRITLSVNSFVPKPFTPFQWESMETVESLNKKLRYLEKAMRKMGNMNIIHDLPKREYVQALLSRGDRRLGMLLREAHANGEDWKKAAKTTGIDTDFFVQRKRAFAELLPWDFIDIGVRKEYLMNEFQRALEGKFTPPCRVGTCKTCGVCG